MELNIGGLSRASVLAALYNAARPKGLGFLEYDPRPISAEEAEEIILLGDDNRRKFGSLGPEYNEEFCFDYVYGRALKLDLTFDDILVYAYDEYNGEGMANRAIQHLRETGEVMSLEIIKIQNEKVLREDAMDVFDNIDTETTFSFQGNVYSIGLAKKADELRIAVQEVEKKIPA